MKFPEAVALIESAPDPHTLLGAAYDVNYRAFAKVVHPDKHTDPKQKARAEKAFTRLNEFYQRLSGKDKPVQMPRCGDWFVQRTLVAGDVADLYVVEGIPKHTTLRVPVDAILKIAKSEAQNDLLEREAHTLKHLYAKKDAKHVEWFCCELYDHFEASGRQVNVLAPALDCVPLSQIRDQIGPIPWRHVIWMMSRALEILGHCHRVGVLHGSVTPDHLLYRPGDHGLKLVDWTASVGMPSETDFIPYRSGGWKQLYPPEVDKKDCYNCTDLYMLVKSLVEVAEAPPRRFRLWIEWCLAKSAFSRPDDAWALNDRWRELAELEYGPPAFVPLVLPIN